MLCSVPATLSAQEAEEPAPAEDEGSAATPTAGLEALKVTGNTGGQVWQDAPNSSIGFDALELQRERVQDISDISNFTPNLEIKTAFAASNPTLFIRGIGLDDFNANSASAVAVYQDGVYLNSPAGQLFQFFDVAGVRVLRGPHAGEYRNASAGAILVESQRPQPKFSANGTFTYGNYNLIEGDGALNLPLIPNILSSRISGKVTFQDGFTDNRCEDQTLKRFNQPPFTNEDCFLVFAPGFSLGESQDLEDPVNDAQNWALRSQLLFDVPLRETEMEWLLNVHGGRNESLASQFQHRGFAPLNGADPNSPKVPDTDSTDYEDRDGDPFAGDYNNGGDEDLELFGVNLKGRWAASDVHEVVSLSAVEWHDRETLENTDANPRNLLTTLYRDEAWQFSQDLRVESFWTDSLETTLGGYFIMEDLEVENEFEQTTVFLLDLDYTQDIRSYAFFGVLGWDFLRDFRFDADVRYTQEYKSFDNFSTANNSAGVSGVGLNLDSDETVFRGVSGSASVTWRITPDHSVYAKYTRGWKPGHFNGGSAFSAQLIEPVRPEELDSFEIGAKGSWFDGRLTADLVGFYYDFRDLQIFALEQDAGSFPLPQLINAQGAEVLGVELGFRVEPIRGLDLRLDAAYLDSEYTEFVNTLFRVPPTPPGQPRPDPVPIPIDYTGNPLIGSPEFTASGTVQYALPVYLGETNLGELIPRVSISWKDETFFDAAKGKGTLQDLPDGTIGQGSYALYNGSFTWRSPDQHIELTGWIRNISDKEYRVQSFDVSDGFNFVIDAYGAPRTYGVTISGFF